MNLLQTNQQGGAQPPSGGGMPMFQQPQQAQQPQQQQPQAQDYNPFNKGITAAMQSARESLGSSQEQQHRSLRSGILGFARQVGQQPRQKGFFNNLAAMGAPLTEGLTAYDQSENANEQANLELAKEIRNRQAYEQKQRDNADHEAWNRKHHEAMLAETKRGHDLSHQDRMQDKGGVVDIDGKEFRKLNKKELAGVRTLKGRTSSALKAINDVNTKLEKFTESTANNTFAPIGGLSEYANPVKDKLGRFFGAKSLEKETADRTAFDAMLGQLVVELENAKTSGGGQGGGKLALGMYDRLKPYYPDLKNDSLETLKLKLEHLTKIANENNNAAQLSYKHGISLDPADLDEFGEEGEQQLPIEAPAKPRARFKLDGQ